MSYYKLKMDFRQYVKNVIYGNYIKYNVNNLFEAIYISKHPHRVSQLNSLSDDKLAKKHIEVYKTSFKQLNDINDFLLKYRIQCIQDWEEKNICLLPSFRYVEFKNNRWAPIIFENVNNIMIPPTITTISSTSSNEPVQQNDSELSVVDIQNYVHQDDYDNITNDDTQTNNKLDKNVPQSLIEKETYPVSNVAKLSTINEVNIKLKQRFIKSIYKNNPKLITKLLTYSY